MFGNCWTFTFSKINTWGLLALKDTSPERISNNEASSACNFNLEGLNLPLGSAKNERSNNEPSPPVSSIILLFSFIKSFLFMVASSNLANNFFVYLDNFASPGIGFRITLLLLRKLIILSPCAETAVTSFPANLA